MDAIWMRYWPEDVPARMKYPDITVSMRVNEWAEKMPNKPAIRYYGRVISYRELSEFMKRVEFQMRAAGVMPGDRVMLFMPNSPAFIIAYLAIQAMGGVVVAANPMFKEDELVYELEDSGSRLIIADTTLQEVTESVLARHPEVAAIYSDFHEFLPLDPFPTLHPDMVPRYFVPPHRQAFSEWLSAAEGSLPPQPCNLDEAALIQYTSGTTGMPKGAVIRHRNLLANVESSRLWTHGHPESVHMTILPLYHVTDMVHSFLMPLWSGGTMILLTRIDPGTFVRTLAYYRATHWVGIATMNIAVVNLPEVTSCDLTSLKSCMSGGAPIPVPIMERFEQLTGVRLVEGYGLSETISQVTVNPLNRPKPGSVGIPQFDVDIRITRLGGDFDQELKVGEEGEIWVRGPQVMEGYWMKPDSTQDVLREDGWLDTGDIGYLDEEGYLHISGRSKELIKVSGFSVFPAEVESLLYRHPAIAEVAVIGIADEYRGESVKAFVVLKPEASEKPEELVLWAREHMARYKAPREVEIRDALPKNGSGKVLRRVLTEEERSR